MLHSALHNCRSTSSDNDTHSRQPKHPLPSIRVRHWRASRPLSLVSTHSRTCPRSSGSAEWSLARQTVEQSGCGGITSDEPRRPLELVTPFPHDLPPPPPFFPPALSRIQGHQFCEDGTAQACIPLPTMLYKSQTFSCTQSKTRHRSKRPLVPQPCVQDGVERTSIHSRRGCSSLRGRAERSASQFQK